MLTFYILSLIVVAATAVTLHKQGYQQYDIVSALYRIAGVQAVGLLISTGITLFALPLEWHYLLGVPVQLGAWFFLLQTLDLPRAWVWGGLGATAVVAILFSDPTISLLTYGFITAVPLITLINTNRHMIPIISSRAQESAPFSLRRVTGSLSPESVESQQPILECLSTGIILSNQEGLIVYINQAAATMMDITPETIIDKPVTDVLTRMPMLSQSGNGRESHSFEMNGRTLEGLVSMIYDKDGAVQGTVAILHDVTARHRAEQTRDNFLTTISHELRTPLTSIKGYIELLGSETGGPLSSSQKMFVNTIQRNVTRMVHLINSLIFASSIHAGRLESASGHADLGQLIQQISREMQPKAAESGQQIKLAIDPRLTPIQADPIHMATILEELVINAIKYNRPKGTLLISASLQGKQQEQSQAYAIVSITDEGLGIDPKDQQHIFEGFYRPDGRDDQVRGGGIGIGLSIVHALVEAYNGRIWFDTQIGEGTTFTFIIPTEQPILFSTT